MFARRHYFSIKFEDHLEYDLDLRLRFVDAQHTAMRLSKMPGVEEVTVRDSRFYRGHGRDGYWSGALR